MSVCEDETTAYNYWQEHFNHNPSDCCNLRNSKATKIIIAQKGRLL